MSSNAPESVNSTDKTLVDLLRLQLAELEMLTSMYPNESEFRVDDPSAIPDILDFCEGHRQVMPQRLDFTINLHVEKVTLELSCTLPHDYPEADPEVYVRAPSGLDREQQHELNMNMTSFLLDLPEGELRVLVLIQWLSENGAKYINASKRKPEDEENGRQSGGSDPEDCDSSFSRLWIYSHHIYNKAKRRSILETGCDLRLTGFCLPGKPGIICVEGYTKDCNRFWEIIRVMNWKRIMLKKKETFKPNDVAEPASNHNSNANAKCSLDDWRKFGALREVCFKPRQGPGREYHMDMGEFFKFLENHHSGYVFKDYFGVDGKLTNPNGHS